MCKGLKLIPAILILCLSSALCAAQNKVNRVTIDVALDSLGGAFVRELWDVDVQNSSNTEWYLAKYGLDAGTLRDLTVTDVLEGDAFITEPSWDVDRTREQKKGRCGIVDKGGHSYELCWGVGSNGPHLWLVEYQYDNLMTAFADSCAFNHMFISDDLASPPDTASVTIRYPGKALTDSLASVWTFGHNGYVAYRDSAIVAWTEGALSKNEGVIIMAAFDKTLFDAENKSDELFQTMKDKAFEKSDYVYEKTPWWEELLYGLGFFFIVILGYILVNAGPLLIVVGVVGIFKFVIPAIWGTISVYPLRMLIRRKMLFKGTSNWRRDIPDIEDLTHIPQIMSHYSYNILSKPSGWDNELTAAYIMKLLCEGGLKLYKKKDEKGNVRTLLQVVKGWKPGGATSDDIATDALYDILKKASGNDLILQDGELKEWKKKTGLQAIKSFYNFREHDDFKVNEDEARQVLGLYNYLNDFSLLSERGMMEVDLWNKYLVYATAFGIGDKVMKEMRLVAPEYFELSRVKDFVDTDGTFLLRTDSLCQMSSDIKEKFFDSPASSGSSGGGGGSFGGYSSRSSGGGGHSSYHGGGGHTGGGGGGGR